jgi:hypothetical protein
MDVLTEQKIIELMREEWGNKVLQLEKAVNAFMDTSDGQEKFIFDVGNKVRHDKSGIEYTISAIDPGKRVVYLRSPDGSEAPRSWDDFDGPKAEYVLPVLQKKKA